LIVDEQGRPVKVTGTGQDITARIQLEDALARYAAVIESSEDAIITKTLTGTILSWNPGAERLYGYRAEEVEGHPISILFPPERRDEWERTLDRVRRGAHVEHQETVRVRRGGRRVQVSVGRSPRQGPGGRGGGGR